MVRCGLGIGPSDGKVWAGYSALELLSGWVSLRYTL